jgi:hypothetical protein
MKKVLKRQRTHQPRRTVFDLATDILELASYGDLFDRAFRVRSRRDARIEVQEIAERVLEPHMPRGVSPCILLPRYRESVRQYAARVVMDAALRAKGLWGLRGLVPLSPHTKRGKS